MAQTLPPCELVVCDDQSSDATLTILERLAEEAAFPFRLSRNPERLGSTRNFETAIALCEGELIALADQDDVWVTDKLAVLYTEFEQQPDIDVFFTDAEVVNDQLAPLGYSLYDHVMFGPNERALFVRGDAIDLFVLRCFATGATMALRAAFRDWILPIPASSRLVIHDRWIANVAYAAGRLGFLDRRLIAYRQHSAQQVGATRPESRRSAFPTAEEVRSRTQESYAEALLDVKLLHDRISLRAVSEAEWNAAWRLGDRIQHLEARLSLPANRLARTLSVLREVGTGRYRSYSAGWMSAAKDIFVQSSLDKPDIL